MPHSPAARQTWYARNRERLIEKCRDYSREKYRREKHIRAAFKKLGISEKREYIRKKYGGCDHGC